MESNSRIIRFDNVLPPSDAAVKGWHDYRSRSTNLDVMTSFYNSDAAASLMEFDKVENVMSVGSAEGDVDSLLLSRCLNLKEYVGIEPDTAMCEDAYKKISSRFSNNAKITLINGFFEEVANIGNDFDAILFNHALYYFRDDLPGTIKHATKFLRPGGLIYIISAYGILHKITESGCANMDEKIREALAVNNFEFKEEKLESIHVDISESGNTYYGFMSLFHTQAVPEEKKKEIMDKLQDIIVPGTTSKVPSTQMIFVAQQKTNKF